jgi:hypothetical protein
MGNVGMAIPGNANEGRPGSVTLKLGSVGNSGTAGIGKVGTASERTKLGNAQLLGIRENCTSASSSEELLALRQ